MLGRRVSAAAILLFLSVLVSPPWGIAPTPARADPPDSNQGGGTQVPSSPGKTHPDKDIDEGDEKEPNGDEGHAPTDQQTREEHAEVEGCYLPGNEGGQTPGSPGMQGGCPGMPTGQGGGSSTGGSGGPPGGCVMPGPGGGGGPTRGSGSPAPSLRPSLRPSIKPPLTSGPAQFLRNPGLTDVGAGVGLNLTYGSRLEYNGAYGQSWDFGLNQAVTPKAGGGMTWASGKGVDVDFMAAAAGTWSGPSHMHQTLTDFGASANPRYSLADKYGNQHLFRSDGKLDSMKNRWGDTVQLAYNAFSQLTSVTDTRGMITQFSYYSTGRLKAIDDFAGRRTLLEYDLNDDLAKVNYWDPGSNQTRTIQMAYNSGASDPRLNHNLTAVKDFTGQTMKTVSYGSTGVDFDRVMTSQLTGERAYAYQTVGTYGTDWTTRVSSGGAVLFDYHYNGGGLLADETVYATQGGQQGVALVTTFAYNGNGELTKTVLPSGQRRERTLDSMGNVLSYRTKATDTNQNGSDDLVWSATYESVYNQPLTITRPDASTLTYQYNASKSVTQIDESIDSIGTNATTLFSWDSAGHLTKRTDPDGIEVAVTYATTGVANGFVTALARGPASQQHTTTYARNSTGAVTSATDALGNRVDYAVSAWGEIQGVTSPASLGYEIAYDRDQNQRISQVNVENVNENGVRDSSLPWIRTIPTRDQLGRVTAVTEDIDAGHQRTFGYTYNDRHLVEKVTLPEGNSSKFEYEERGLVSKVRLAEGTSLEGAWTFSYDSVGNAVSATDPRGKTATLEYDGFGSLVRTTMPLGTDRVLLRDKLQRVIEAKVEDSAGNTTSKTEYVHDLMGRVVQVKKHEFGAGLTPTVRTTTITRRPGGQPASVQYPDGYTVTYSYDAWGRCSEIRDPANNRVQFTYDLASRLTREDRVEIEGGATKTYSTEYEYDAVGRVTKSRKIDANNSSVVIEQTFKYDSKGNLIETSGGGAAGARFTYDAQGKVLTTSVDPQGLNRMSQALYDKNDRLLAFSDPSGNATTYTYDVRGRATSVVYPNNLAIGLQYDAGGNVTRLTDLMGTVVDTTYDDDGRVTHRSINRGPGVLGTTFEDFVWDAMGRLVEARNDLSTVQITYDSMGKVRTETQGPNPIGQSGRTVTHAYGPEGLPAGMTYPSGLAMSYQRDSLGRLTTLSDTGGFGTTSLSYVGQERAQQITYGNGTKTDYAWDGFQRLNSIGHLAPGGTPFYQVDFLFRGDGKKLYERDVLNGGIGDVYQYLGDGRLGTVTYGVPNPLAEVQTPGSQPFASRTNYAFDAVGNRTTVTVTPGGGGAPTATAYQSNSLNQYTSVGGQARAYDANGNLSTTSTAVYEYDYAGHLLRATVSGVVVGTYEYDALGRRITKTTQSGTTSFVHAGDDVIEQYNMSGGGGLAARYGHIGTPDHHLFYEAQDSADVNQNGNTTEWLRFTYHTDVRGSPVQMTSPTGAVIESYKYDIYGQATIRDRQGQTVGTSPIKNPYLYTGREWDAETGLYHYRARAYDPQTGSFLQRDPLGYRAGPHLYQYVGADPVNFTDPYGLDKTPDQSGGCPGAPGGSGSRPPNVNPDGTTDLTNEEIGRGESDSARADRDPDKVKEFNDEQERRLRESDPEWNAEIDSLPYDDYNPWDARNGYRPWDYEGIGVGGGYDDVGRYRDSSDAQFQNGDNPWEGQECSPETAEQIRYEMEMRAKADQALAEINEAICKPLIIAAYGAVAGEALAAMGPGGGGPLAGARASGPMTKDQQALKDIVKEATNGGRKPLSSTDANTVGQWAKETNYPGFRAGGNCANNPSNWAGGGGQPHIHVPGASNSGHIPIR